MSTIIRGSLLPYLQNQHFEFDPYRGQIHGFDFKGASQAQMKNLYLEYVNAGIACMLRLNQGDTASLEVEDATYTYTIDTWQLVANQEARDGLSHPALAVGLAGYDVESVIADMRKYLEEHKDPSVLFGTGGDMEGSPAIVERFYRLQTRGSTEYRRGQYVLRHATNVPARWTVNIADFRVDCIYTPAQLLTEVQNASLWAYPLPPRLSYKISNIPAPTAQTNYLWGWLKGASTETTAANNRVEICTEYCCEQWSTDYYPAY